MITYERAYQEEQNGASFSFIAPSIEELWVPNVQIYEHGKGPSLQRIIKRSNTHNSSLEGAMELKFAPFCSSSDALSDEIIIWHNRNFIF